MATFASPRTATVKRPVHIDQSRLFANFMNNLHGRKICTCNSTPVDPNKVQECLEKRNVRDLKNITNCRYFKKFTFQDPKECNLYDQIRRIYEIVVSQYPDVVGYNAQKAKVYFEGLVEIPEENFGDLTGDHGKQISLFIQACLQENLITSSIDIIFDIGGQNSSTVKLVSEIINPKPLNFIVDINLLTPALVPQEENIKYIVDDAFDFFLPQNYDELANEYDLANKTNMFLFNNFLNLLYPDQGWKSLIFCWGNMNKGDYLVISGLTTEQLSQWSFLNQDMEIEGIVPFYIKKEGEFYKSTLTADFSDHLSKRFPDALISKQETFVFDIKQQNGKTLPVQGRRLLIQKK